MYKKRETQNISFGDEVGQHLSSIDIPLQCNIFKMCLGVLPLKPISLALKQAPRKQEELSLSAMNGGHHSPPPQIVKKSPTRVYFVPPPRQDLNQMFLRNWYAECKHTHGSASKCTYTILMGTLCSPRMGTDTQTHVGLYKTCPILHPRPSPRGCLKKENQPCSSFTHLHRIKTENLILMNSPEPLSGPHSNLCLLAVFSHCFFLFFSFLVFLSSIMLKSC